MAEEEWEGLHDKEVAVAITSKEQAEREREGKAGGTIIHMKKSGSRGSLEDETSQKMTKGFSYSHFYDCIFFIADLTAAGKTGDMYGDVIQDLQDELIEKQQAGKRKWKERAHVYTQFYEWDVEVACTLLHV